MTTKDQSSIGSPPTSPIHGLLYSQIGYDINASIRVIVRSTDRAYLSSIARCRVQTIANTPSTFDEPLVYWGDIWGSHWWVADFTGKLNAGEYQLQVIDQSEILLHGDGLRVGPNLLWDRTWEHVSYEQLKRRAIIAKVKPGWYDAGVLWEESNSHSAMLLGLFDLLEHGQNQFSPEQLQRLLTQARGGCDYLLLTAERATKLGHAPGAMVLDMLELQHMVMMADVSKASVALARGARLLPGDTDTYLNASMKALRWVLDTSKPAGADGFGARAHGVAQSFIPPNEHRTSDLMMCCWAAVELTQAGQPDMQEQSINLAQALLSRQVPQDKAEDGLYGHFYTYKTGDLTEKAWTHSGAYHPNGADNGQTFPQYVMPIIQMLRLWPDHPQADTWHEAMHNYAYGFFLPACRLSPFYILPLGYYPKEGWLHFAGLWHGMNAVYGLAAALGLEFDSLFDDPDFRDIATGNLQWIAGLNAGMTNESIRAATMWSTDIPDEIALPHSFVQGIGNRSAGCWMNIRGSIANGFGCGEQFKLDVQPTRLNDGPFALHDEDWITHGGGWLCGLSRLIPKQTT